MGKIDFVGINRAILVNYQSVLCEWIPGGHMEGVQYVVRSPFRVDKTVGSFKVNTQTGVYKDFADEPIKGPDPIHLYARLRRLEQGEAAKELSGRFNSGYVPSVPEKPPPKKWRIIDPVPEDAPEPPKKYGTYERPESGKKVWIEYDIKVYYKYKNEVGELIGYTCRVEPGNGKKKVVPLTYQTDGVVKEWRFKSWDKPRPIYGLDDLANNPTAQVLAVEGEKCKDYAKELFKDHDNIVVISWVGGSDGAKAINWKPLSGRKIISWPDADSQRYKKGHARDGEVMDFIDQPGASAMITIYNLTKNSIAGARLIKPPKDWVNGKDVADLKDWDCTKVSKFISENLITFESVSQKPDKKDSPSTPFQCLGYNSYQGGVTYFYLPKGTRKVTSLSANGHTKMNMLSLAPVTYYEREYTKSTGADFVAAANDCMRLNEHIGIYDPERVRGRGAWFDDGRIVLHLGDRLIVDGKVKKITTIKSKYIYEAEIPIEGSLDFMSNSLTASQAEKVLQICKMISWKTDINASLFAGWMMLAPICGALEWRPHIWLTGESGSGKSWILDNIVDPILGKGVIKPEANSTEAAIRQMLKNDAFSVRHDEFESEDSTAAWRSQKVIELARSASSNSGSCIIKGTISGRPLVYFIRSCFLFSSVNVRLAQQADQSRIKVLSLVKREDYEKDSVFDDLQKLVIKTLTEEYCQRLRARAIKLIPDIRENARTFSRLIATAMKSKREGDQIGALLAGAYNLKHNGLVNEEDAKAYVDSHDWGTELTSTARTDQERCVETILQQIIRLEGGRSESVGSLIRRAGRSRLSSTMLNQEECVTIERERGVCRDILRKYGITTISSRDSEEYEIAFCENHSQLKDLLKDTPWHDGYKLILHRFEGATRKTAVFGDGLRAGAVVIPYENFAFESFEEEEVF